MLIVFPSHISQSCQEGICRAGDSFTARSTEEVEDISVEAELYDLRPMGAK